MSASGLDVEKHAAYEHRKFLSHLSDKLSKTELRKIVFHEDLPKGLLDGENKYPDPMDVMINLHMQKKTAPEELSRILSDVNRQDLVKLVAKSAKKNPQKRKTSGPSSPKLEDTLSLTVKSSDLLAEHVELALKHAAASRENKRIEELVSEAKSNLISVVQRKLRYAYGLLNSQTQTEQCACNPSSSSTGSSPESSLTLKPPDPGHQRPQITLNDADLKKVFENLKPPSVVTRRGENCRSCSQYNIITILFAGAASSTSRMLPRSNSAAGPKQATSTQDTQKGKENHMQLPCQIIKEFK